MFKVKLSLCALMVFAALATALPAQADVSPSGDGPANVNPTAIAQRCIDQVTHKAERCVEYNRHVARHTVNVIGDLLEQGKVEHAKKVAHSAIKDIRRASDYCVESIIADCRECIAKLNRLHAHRLANRVQEVCEDLVARVRHSERAAIRAILTALNDGPRIG